MYLSKAIYRRHSLFEVIDVIAVFSCGILNHLVHSLVNFTTEVYKDMIGHAVVEFIGHIIFSFTRSVAEHSDFDEAERDLELFGYNPLEDTGKEWYCQPVDELIYQEYSDRDVTTFDYLPSSNIQARFLNAFSTEETEETEGVGSDRAMAWKRFRPSFVRTVCDPAYVEFLMSVLSATIVGVVSILVTYLSFQTQLNCLVHPEKSIPNKLQWIRAISEAIFAFFFYCWIFVNCLFYFRPFQISDLKLTLFVTALAFYYCDVCYRLLQALVFSHFKLTKLQVLPGNLLLLLCLCTQVCIITKHFCRGAGKKQLSLFLSLTIPFGLTFVTGILQSYFMYPTYNRQGNIVDKALIAIFAPLITVFLKGLSRFCVQRLWRISHPGHSLVLLIPLYYGSAVMLRFLQVDFENVEVIAVIGVIHGIAEVIERSAMVLIDHIYHQIWQRRVVRFGNFRTPRRERLAADIVIMSILYESSGVISVNGFLYLYRYFYISDNFALQLLQSFARTTSVALAIEWFFASLSLAIETRYQNMPVMAVWRRRWKKHIVVAIVNAVVMASWLSSSLILTAVVNNERSVGKPKDFCLMPFES